MNNINKISKPKRPRVTGMPNGRPRIEINKEVLIDSFNRNQNWDIVAKELGVSRSTLFLRRRELNIQKVTKQLIVDGNIYTTVTLQ